MQPIPSSQNKELQRLEKLMAVGTALSAELNYDLLLEMIITSAKELTNSDGATLYTITDDNKLHFEIVRTELLKGRDGKGICFHWGGKDQSSEILFPDIPIYNLDDTANERMASVFAYTRGVIVNIPDAYKSDQFDFLGIKEFDAKTGYHTKSVLTVPMKNQEQKIVGILQLINAKDPATSQLVAFSLEDERLVQALASLGAVAITNHNLRQQQINLLASLSRILTIGVALSAERDHDRLLEMILESAKELTYADGGTLYTITADNKLHFEIVRTDSLKLKWGGTVKSSIEGTEQRTFSDISLYDEDGKPNDRMVVVYAATHKCTVNIFDAYETKHFDFVGTRKFDEKTGYRSKSFLTVPLLNHEQEIIGVLQLINKQDPKNGPIEAFSKDDQLLVESFASQAAIAITNQKLIEELRTLFESFINVLADAIDEKSPVTGRHCRRVPIIAAMIADAVNDTHEGSYRNTEFTPAELYELNIAALLHDCGKVTTPVHVVEKGKKLETIIDRIQLLDARLEILKRDQHIRALNLKLKLLHSKVPELFKELEKPFAEIDKSLLQEVDQLKRDKAFLRECNKGTEFMSQESQDRVKLLAATTWEDMDNLQQPMINSGELENLLIPKGTLTPEEREVIKNHVVMTIKMLKKIPYPKYLREIPEIAGKHHERIDGKGYPLGLKGNQMSIRARILAIADIFEALTAPDRPYKESMPLSTAIQILGKMKDEGHIDPELYDVFLNQKVYLKYAKEHLRPEQIDVK